MKQSGQMIRVDFNLKVLPEPLGQLGRGPGALRLVNKMLKRQQHLFGDLASRPRVGLIRQSAEAPIDKSLDVLADGLFMVSQVPGYARDVPSRVRQSHHFQSVTNAGVNAWLTAAFPQLLPLLVVQFNSNQGRVPPAIDSTTSLRRSA